MQKISFYLASLILLTQFTSASAFSAPNSIRTNETVFENPPSWLTERRVEKVIDQVQRFMEWNIRRISVVCYTDPGSFQKVHGFDSTVLAVSRKTDNTIHLGPRTTSDNFDAVFGHELVHIILFQKYKDAIPKWLDEGLANYVSHHGKVDYVWLAAQPSRDVTQLSHPFVSAGQPANSKYHYAASTALIEMIAAKCSLKDLIQLSVGKKLESYLSTFCDIPDVNQSFQNWLKKKAPR